MRTPPAPRVHAVLGMHRSGTSWLAGSLQQKGLALGDVNESATFNKRGNRESSALQQIHDSVLMASGGSFQSVPTKVVWPAESLARLRDFITDMDSRYDRWGFKDPRALLVFDGWRELIPEGISVVGIYRHPDTVARSLAERSPVPRQVGIDLWCAYNERLIAEHRRAPFPVLRFDATRERLLHEIDVVAALWELPDATSDATFFDESLRHHEDMAPVVPRRCRDLWRYLEKHRFTG